MDEFIESIIKNKKLYNRHSLICNSKNNVLLEAIKLDNDKIVIICKECGNIIYNSEKDK